MKTLPWALVALAVFVAMATGMAWRNAERDRKIAEDNVRAANDTIQRYVADSSATSTLLLHQAEISREAMAILNGSLALALDARDVRDVAAVTDIRVVIDSLRAENVSLRDVVATNRQGGIDRILKLEITGHPFLEGDVFAVVPTNPDSAVDFEPGRDVRLRLKPIELKYVLACDAQRAPVVLITGPEWATTEIEAGQVDPDMCNPPPVSISLASMMFAPSLGKILYFVGGFGTAWAWQSLASDGIVIVQQPQRVSLLTVRF